jgi:hypothetical protein
MAKFTCANCEADAPYVYQITPYYGISYCKNHTPNFLKPQLVAGNLDNPAYSIEEPIIEEVVEPTPLTKSSKKKAPLVEEPAIVEEVIAEPASEEAVVPEVTQA